MNDFIFKRSLVAALDHLAAVNDILGFNMSFIKLHCNNFGFVKLPIQPHRGP